MHFDGRQSIPDEIICCDTILNGETSYKHSRRKRHYPLSSLCADYVNRITGEVNIVTELGHSLAYLQWIPAESAVAGTGHNR